MTYIRFASNRVVSLVLALAFLGLALAIVFVWRIGPVVLVLSEEAGRGVHSGDLLAVPCVAGALVLLWRALARQ